MVVVVDENLGLVVVVIVIVALSHHPRLDQVIVDLD
jgi:hypothetical protein